jgi:hypothetical protein
MAETMTAPIPPTDTADPAPLDGHATNPSVPSVPGGRTPAALAAKAAKLVTASERLSFDPFVEVDWSVPMHDDTYYLPPEFLPLYGTAVWDSMSQVERYEYSRHELAALCSAGIWFENILMHLLMKDLYDLPADDGVHRYLLTETADECRHSSMFGEVVRRAGTPAYEVNKWLRHAGRFLKATSRGPEAYLAMLAAEELLDVTNRATMKDERVHPISRRVAKIHVMEEARHVSYARAYATEVWPTLSWVRRAMAMLRTPFIVRAITDALVNREVYDELGIEGGARLARANPNHRARIVRDLGKLTGFLEELGVINPVTRPLWRVLGLVGSTGAAPRSDDDEVRDRVAVAT